MSTVADLLDVQATEERRRAVRALIMAPLLHADRDIEVHRLVRRHATWLRDWFSSGPGWALTIDRDHARLRKVPATTTDATRGAAARRRDPPFSRRRYVLFCLALVHLEDADRQVALGMIADAVMVAVAADPTLGEAGVTFDLDNRDQRRDLVAVIRLLLHVGVLVRVDGDEDAYVRASTDVLYTIDRGVLASVLVTRHPPSTIAAQDLAGRLAALVAEPAAAGEDGRNRDIRRHLLRRLLDDAVVYYDDLDEDHLIYLQRQRHRLVQLVEEGTGLIAEIRAEGIAMVDDRGTATDVHLPDQGTDGHVTLLLAEHLAGRLRDHGPLPVSLAHLHAHTALLVAEHASHWRRDVTEPGAEVGLVADVLGRLAALGLVQLTISGVIPKPALARYRVTAAHVPEPTLFGAAS